MSEESKVPLVNVANALTILRLVLVPVFIWAYLDPSHACLWLPWAVFALAAVTDKLDGYLARSRGLITNFGKIADSIADKFLISAALILLSWSGMLWWWVSILLIARELGITAMRMFVLKREVMAAGHGGKLKMLFQSFGIAGLLIPWHTFLPAIGVTVMLWASWALIGLALVYSITSAYEYVKHAQALMREG